MAKTIKEPKSSRLINSATLDVVCGNMIPQPAVAYAISSQQQIAKLRARAVATASLALDALHSIITDGDARDADRIQASKVILQYSGLDADAPAESGKINPSSMTRSELAEHVERMRSELANRARPIIDQ